MECRQRFPILVGVIVVKKFEILLTTNEEETVIKILRDLFSTVHGRT